MENNEANINIDNDFRFNLTNERGRQTRNSNAERWNKLANKHIQTNITYFLFIRASYANNNIDKASDCLKADIKKAKVPFKKNNNNESQGI